MYTIKYIIVHYKSTIITMHSCTMSSCQARVLAAKVCEPLPGDVHPVSQC